MTDLFANLPTEKPKRNAGYGNAMFLCDLAEGVSDEVMRKKWAAGEYDSIRPDYAKAWRRLMGRK